MSSENFKDYFDISVSVINKRKENDYPFYTGYGDVQLTITAKSPFEIYDVYFQITVHTNTEKYVQFKDVMPQNGSFSSTSDTLSYTGIIENTASVMINGYDIDSVSGYIIQR